MIRGRYITNSGTKFSLIPWLASLIHESNLISGRRSAFRWQSSRCATTRSFVDRIMQEVKKNYSKMAFLLRLSFLPLTTFLVSHPRLRELWFASIKRHERSRARLCTAQRQKKTEKNAKMKKTKGRKKRRMKKEKTKEKNETEGLGDEKGETRKKTSERARKRTHAAGRCFRARNRTHAQPRPCFQK